MPRVETDGGFWVTAALMLLLFPLRFLAGVLIAAAVHEWGHLITIRLTGGKVHRIRLRPGGVRIEAAPMSLGKETLCALAGPAAGALTIIFRRSFPELALAGLVQTVFNLLPFYPLDGGRVMRNICCKMRGFRVQ